MALLNLYHVTIPCDGCTIVRFMIGALFPGAGLSSYPLEEV